MKNIVSHLATLAALDITDSTVEKYEKQLEVIFEYMDQIKQLDLAQVSETYRTTEEENILREDVVTESLEQSEVLKNAKNTHNGFFVVPAIMKEHDVT